jgi:hypothetical protein
MVAVRTTEPAALGVKLFPVILATPAPAVFTLQTMVRLLALSGTTVAPARLTGAPAKPPSGTPVISLTGTKAPAVAIYMVKSLAKGVVEVAPLAIVAVSVSVPAVGGVKEPPATAVSVTPVVSAYFTVHVIVLWVALPGVTVAAPKSNAVPVKPPVCTPVISVTATNASVGFGSGSVVFGHPVISRNAAIRTLPYKILRKENIN